MDNKHLRRGMSLLLVEGVDAERFFINACDKKAFGTDEHIQVWDFHGITELTKCIKGLKKMKDFNSVPAIGIIRDAEDDADGAIRSIQKSLRENSLAVPENPNVFVGDFPKICYALLPGTMSDGKYDKGALEDLCLKTLSESENRYLDKVDAYLQNINELSKLTHRHKSRLHAYLAAKNNFVGMKIGEAAKAGAWDWNSKVLGNIKIMMQELEKYGSVKPRADS